MKFCLKKKRCFQFIFSTGSEFPVHYHQAEIDEKFIANLHLEICLQNHQVAVNFFNCQLVKYFLISYILLIFSWSSWSVSGYLKFYWKIMSKKCRFFAIFTTRWLYIFFKFHQVPRYALTRFFLRTHSYSFTVSS